MSRKTRRFKQAQLTAKTDFAEQLKNRVLPYDLQAVFQTRIDIANWAAAEMLAQSDEPRTYLLQQIFTKVAKDALLTSQIQNRREQLFTVPFTLKNKAGEVDQEQTAILKKSAIFRQITNAILDSDLYWYSLGEIVKDDKGVYTFNTVPRTNVVPQTGMFFANYLEQTNPVYYRNIPEYGTWILEFTGETLGLMNKVVPHVLMKTFAQSCWSELCEIYGIPPRVMKTNTRDAGMLNRAKTMMRQMGAAAWFIIDNNEDFQWATPVVTKGEVYQNIINLCNNEMSMAISGAIVGQDTAHGNRSKDESAQEILWQLVRSDIEKVEQNWNNVVLPALVNVGFLTGDLELEFDQTEDLDQLFKFTQGLLPFKEIDNEWITSKFGVKVTGDKAAPANTFSADFFA